MEWTGDQIALFEAKLRALQATLEQQCEMAKASSQPVDLDEPIGRLSRMDAIQQQKMVAASRRSIEQRLRMVASALDAVRAGQYGLCRECEEPISLGRLEARPEAPFCVPCQTEMEARR